MQAYLGFRKATSADLEALAQWLLERALEHDKPTLLLQLACEQLRREGIVRPGITRLEPLVATARHQAQEETYRRLLPLLIPSRCRWLDALLVPETDTGPPDPARHARAVPAPPAGVPPGSPPGSNPLSPPGGPPPAAPATF